MRACTKSCPTTRSRISRRSRKLPPTCWCWSCIRPLPATSVKEFVAFAKSKPDGLSVANAGLGTPTHLAAVLFAQAADVNLVHVPYRGAAPASTDLIAGQVPAMFNNPVNAVPQVRANNLRALAATGSKRLSLLPDVPTIAEFGYPGFETRTWYGLFGPAGMPADIVRKLHADVERALRMPEIANNLDCARMGHHGEPA